MINNDSGREVVAYGIGFYIFDIFKRDMGRPFVGYDMDAIANGTQSTPGWEMNPGSAYLFQKHGTAIAYVSIVRFGNGEIWKADASEIGRAISDLQYELSNSSGEQ